MEKNQLNHEHLDKKLTGRDLFFIFVRSNFQQASFNFERIHALGFCYDMVPVIKKMYKDEEEQKQALKRHLAFFNTTPAMVGPVIGVAAAMEEKRAYNLDNPTTKEGTTDEENKIDDGAINSMKVGLMGPLAGVGDPIVWGTLRPITASLGATLALAGNIFGPILFFLLFNIVRLSMKWYGLVYGYRKGVDIVKELSGNRLQKLTQGATILGLFVIGSLVATWTNISVPLVISSAENQEGETVETTMQDILDDLLPGLLPLLLTFLIMWILRKNVNPIWIIFSIFGLGIIGYWAGILA